MLTDQTTALDDEGLKTLARPIARIVSEAALDLESFHGTAALAEAELAVEVREVFKRTGREIAPSRAVMIAATIRNFPEHWRDFRSGDSFDADMASFIAALAEIADPQVWAARLRREADSKVRGAAYKLDAAREHLSRIGWASKTPAEQMDLAIACTAGATRDIEEAQRLLAEANAREAGQ